MSSNRYNIALLPSGRRIQAGEGQTLFQALARAGIQLRSECGGKGVCTKCLVAIQVAPGTESHRPVEHLACQWEVQSDLAVEIPLTSLAPAEVITKPTFVRRFGPARTMPTKHPVFRPRAFVFSIESIGHNHHTSANADAPDRGRIRIK